MSVFRTRKPIGSMPETPAVLFMDLKKAGGVKFLWGHQQKVLDEYSHAFLNAKDVAIELPTGTGKTLIALLIAEFRRLTRRERVAYLCPTKQLANQVNARAIEYGINTVLLVGPQRDYDGAAFSSYQQAQSIAITTYSAVFNTNPKIDSPETVILDDAHSADSYISSMWEIEASRDTRTSLFDAVVDVLGDAVPELLRATLDKGQQALAVGKRGLVHLVPLPLYARALGRLTDELDKQCVDDELKYPWQMLRGHLEACNIYISASSMLVRPFIVPALVHHPFSEATQRVYLTATLGEGGDLERATGVPVVQRLPVPPEWDRRGSGRRLVLFPDALSLERETEMAIEAALESPNRTLVLAPDNRSASTFIAKYGGDASIMRAKDIESSLDGYKGMEGRTCLVLANRYDGIDLPDEACRRLVFAGLPSATNLQERFFEQKLRALSFLRNRIRTRITQGMGRCTRNESDYALVLALGDDMLKWCNTLSNTEGLHPELQAEIAFGLENSSRSTVAQFRDYYRAFFEQGEDWSAANSDIVARRNEGRRIVDDVSKALAKSASLEVKHVYARWGQDFESAYDTANAASEFLSGDALQPFRAYWHYEAATSAFLSDLKSGTKSKIANFQDHIRRAIKCRVGTDWLASVAQRASVPLSAAPSVPVRSEIVSQLLQEWGIAGGKYGRFVEEARAAINGTEAAAFSRALSILGRMLGFETTTPSESAAPDCVWLAVDDTAIVIEAKSDEAPDHAISLRTVEQASNHGNWVRAHGEIPAGTQVLTVVASPRRTVAEDAAVSAAELRYVHVDTLREMFGDAVTTLTGVRARARGVTPEELEQLIDTSYASANLGNAQVRESLTHTRLRELPPG